MYRRLLTFIQHPVPDLLKPAYSFGGLSWTQMLKPYVDDWLRTKGSVADLIRNFSIIVMLTNMSATLQGGGGEELRLRAAMFNSFRDNRGLLMADKDTEDIKNVAVPLSSLDLLQAQAQEHIASVAQTPLVKLLGVTPSGLNASSDGEIRTYYDRIASFQEDIREQLQTASEIVQMSEFGEIDPEITFTFEPLWQLDDAGLAAVEKTEADIDEEYVNMGALGPDEIRQALARRKESRYAGLDLDTPAPTPPAEKLTELNDPETSRIDKEAETAGGGGGSGVASGV